MELERLRLRSCTRWYYKYYSFRGSLTFFLPGPFFDISLIFVALGLHELQCIKKMFYILFSWKMKKILSKLYNLFEDIDVELFRLFEMF